MSEACILHPWADLLPEGTDPCAETSQALLDALQNPYRDIASEPAELATLDAARASLEAAQPGLWSRLWDWLGGWLQSLSENNNARFVEWARNLRFPEHYGQWLLYGSIGTLVLLSAVVIWREYRASRYRKREYRQAARWAFGTQNSDATDALAADALEQAEPHRVPALAMRLVLDRLRARQWLPDRNNLTHRQVLEALEPQGMLPSLRRLARAAEQSAYAGCAADADTARAIRADLPELIAAIETRAA